MVEEKIEVPERVYLSRFWQSYIEHNCQFRFEQKFKDDILYVRSDTPNTRQRAERAVAKIVALLIDHERNHPFGGYPRQSMTDIIAAEFEG